MEKILFSFQAMAAMGNVKSNEIYEKNVPVCWRRPTPIDHRTDFYIEEWIRAKYERKEFMEGNDSKQAYCKGKHFVFRLIVEYTQ